ncbi:MAG: PAS domain S-box protein [Desulfobacterales bacterium]|nr:MAG: PAS domain S-box protein [Desulfobacterales bacterium]
MLKDILQSNIAIVGGGKFCKTLLQLLYSELFSDQRPRILGVADINSEAEGLLYAKEVGIFTTHDYRKIFQLNKLQILIELTKDVELGSLLRKAKPSHIKLIDHVESRALWSSLQLEVEKRKALRKLRQKKIFTPEIDTLFEEFADHLGEVIEKRNYRYIEIEKELTTSQRALAQIVQGSTIPTFVIDKNHRVTHWNRACEKLTEYPAELLVGTNKHWMPFRAQERPIMADLILDQVKEEDVWKYYGTKWHKSALIEGAYEAEEFFPHFGEDGKWLFFTAAPIKAPDGTIAGAIETLWDTTADKKAQEALERHHRELAASERTLAQIVQGSTIPTFVIDENHIVTHWNKAIEMLSGVLAEEMVGTNRQSIPFWGKVRPSMADVILDQTDAEDIQKLYAGKWRKSALIEGAYEAEAFLPKPGKWCWFTAAPIKAPDGRIIGAIETIWDKTEEKNAEEQRQRYTSEIRRQSNFQNKLIRSSNDGIVATDKALNIVIFNPGAERIFGYSADEVIDKINGMDLYPPEIAKAFKNKKLLNNVTRELPWKEALITAKDGTPIPVRFSGRLLYEKKQITGSVAFFQDLREIKRLEMELVKSERLAAIGQTVAGLAHGIKNILHGLKGGSYLVDVGLQKNDTEKLKNGWDMIKRNIGSTSNLVMDLLSYSKEREPEYEPCCPNEIADDICELLAETANENNIRLVKDFDLSIGEVSMDPHTIHEVLLNLMTNAIDACLFDEDTGRSWQISMKTTREKDNWIRFEIADNGVGMRKEIRDKLFTSFFSTKGHRGTGLGLMVTRKLIEEHQGTVKVKSQAGQGTTFTVRLPYRKLDRA